jgi:hypothetical protein
MSTTKATVVAAASAGTTSAARPSRCARALAVLAAAAATVTVWAIAGPLAGVDLSVQLGSATQHVGPATVAIVSIAAGLAAWGLLAALEHFTPRARAVWTIALVTLALSLAGPLIDGATPATKVALTGMHLAAAVILVFMLPGRVVPR